MPLTLLGLLSGHWNLLHRTARLQCPGDQESKLRSAHTPSLLQVGPSLVESKGRVFLREITKVAWAGGLLKWISMGINEEVVRFSEQGQDVRKERDAARIARTEP